MPTFQEHIDQHIHNLDFLSAISIGVGNSLDWQVTVIFYSALHLVNAHLALSGHHFRNHQDVDLLISPEGRIRDCRVDPEIYTAYRKLRSLSRISRYLINAETRTEPPNDISRIQQRHLARALKQLDKIIGWFIAKPRFSSKKVSVKCTDFSVNEKLMNLDLRWD